MRALPARRLARMRASHRGFPLPERVDSAVGEHGDHDEREQRLGHHQDLHQPAEDGRVGRAEGRAGVEGEKEIVYETRRSGETSLIAERHLGKDEVLALVGVHPAEIRPAAVYLPVPHRERDDVGNPDQGRVAQQYRRGRTASRQRRDQERHAGGDGEGDEDTRHKEALGNDWAALDPDNRYFAVVGEENHHEILRKVANL